MRTGIDYMFEQFNVMATFTTEYLSKLNETNMFLAACHINYIEGIAFAALMAHKENENDSDIAVRMSQEARVLRNAYYEKLRTK